MQRTPHFSAAEESTAQSIAWLDLSCLRNAGPSTAVHPAKRKLRADIICPRALSFTPLARFGAVESVVSQKRWRTVIEVRCSSRLKTESRRLLSQRSVAAHTAIQFQKQHTLR